MSKLKMYLFTLLFACIWILNGCNNDDAVSYQILHIEGVSWVSNISTTYASFGAGTENEKSGRVSLPVSDGDLLYLYNEDDFELYYRYKLEDGNLLTVSFDSMITNSAHVNGSLAFLQITENPSSWDAFTALSTSEVNNLSTLFISDSLNDEILDILRVHESSLTGTGLVLGNHIEEGVLKELLSICRPRWLVLNGGAELNKDNSEKFLADLELLWITGDIHAISSMFHCCTNLESLIITEWEPLQGELIPLSGLENLHSLTLGECNITDLSNFEFPTSLERLHLILCESLTDISGIEQLTGLNSLSLTESGNLESLEIMNKLGTLRRISFPVNTTQEEFQSILTNHESLEVVELINCPYVSDISFLRDQTHLKAFMYKAEEYDIDQFTELDQLELLILDHTHFEDSPESISQLRTILPNTEIVPGSGLCLGSGWLMLLLPLAFFCRMLFRRMTQL